MTHMSASRTSRIGLVVRRMTPTKREVCWAMSRVAKAPPKTIPRYLTLSPVNIFQAIQLMTASALGDRFFSHLARRERAAEVDSGRAKNLEGAAGRRYTRTMSSISPVVELLLRWEELR